MKRPDEFDGLGFLGSLLGLVALFFAQKYILAGLFGALAIFLAGRFILRRHRAVFRFHELSHTLIVCDGTGSLVDWTKEILFTPMKSGITQWDDGNFNVAGSVEVLETHPGRLERPHERAAHLRVTTLFDVPLKRGERVRKVIALRAYDSYGRQNEEEFDWWIPADCFYDVLRVSIQLPPNRVCRGTPEMAYSRGGRTHRVGYGEISHDRREVRFEVKRPRAGVQYEFCWEW